MIVEHDTDNFADLVLSECRTRPAMGDGLDDAQALRELAAILERRADAIDPGISYRNEFDQNPKLKQAIKRVKALRRVSSDLLTIASRLDSQDH